MIQPRIGAGLLPDVANKTMQREHAIRQLAKLEGYRLEKKGDDSYRLINAKFNVAVYQHDGVPLKKIAEFLEKRTSEKNSTGRLL